MRALTLQFRKDSLQAKLRDSKRDFLFAGQSFYKLSNNPLLDPEDAEDQLKQAMTCAILCKAGDTKFRLMAQIHKDERSKKVDPHFEILDKFFMGHLIKDSDIRSFEDDILVDHQKAKDGNGKTVLQAAIIEHNILVLSKIYLNITFTQLGKNLGIPADQAESMISIMVQEKRIDAMLDQITNSIDFEVKTGGAAIKLAGISKEKEDEVEVHHRTTKTELEILDFNKSIHHVCSNIDTLINDILKEHPDLQKYDS